MLEVTAAASAALDRRDLSANLPATRGGLLAGDGGDQQRGGDNSFLRWRQAVAVCRTLQLELRKRSKSSSLDVDEVGGSPARWCARQLSPDKNRYYT